MVRDDGDVHKIATGLQRCSGGWYNLYLGAHAVELMRGVVAKILPNFARQIMNHEPYGQTGKTSYEQMEAFGDFSENVSLSLWADGPH